MSGCGSRFRSLVFVLLAMLLSGCGGQQTSTAPTPTVAPANNSTALPPTRALQPLHIAGRVLDATNAPVPSARVTQWDTANTTTTDANGAFEMTASVTPQDRQFWVSVEKPGFETSEPERDIQTATRA